MSSKDENDKILISSKDKNKDENENMLLEHIEDIDDKLFTEYIKGKPFHSFINEFDCATNKEDKEKVIKKLKNINFFVNQEIFIMNEDSEYRSKLIGIANAIDYFLDEFSKK